jgi:WD40 repeat protein
VAGCRHCPNQGDLPMTAPLRWQATPHAGYFINAVGISADGRKTVAGTFFHSYSDERRTSADSNSGNFGIYCWDSAGTLQWSNTFTGYEGVYWATLSADGGYAASSGWYSSTPTYSGFIAAFDAATGAPVLDYYKTPTRVNQVVLNSDGSVLAAGGDQLYLFFRSGAQFTTTPSKLPVASGDSVISLGISADGQWVAAGTYTGTVLLVKIVGCCTVITQYVVARRHQHRAQRGDGDERAGLRGGDEER